MGWSGCVPGCVCYGWVRGLWWGACAMAWFMGGGKLRVLTLGSEAVAGCVRYGSVHGRWQAACVMARFAESGWMRALRLGRGPCWASCGWRPCGLAPSGLKEASRASLVCVAGGRYVGSGWLCGFAAPVLVCGTRVGLRPLCGLAAPVWAGGERVRLQVCSSRAVAGVRSVGASGPPSSCWGLGQCCKIHR